MTVYWCIYASPDINKSQSGSMMNSPHPQSIMVSQTTCNSIVCLTAFSQRAINPQVFPCHNVIMTCDCDKNNIAVCDIIKLGQIKIIFHYNDVIMSPMAFQITSLTIVYSIIHSGADQRKHQSSASLAFVRGINRWPVNSPHKGPVTRKMFPFDDVIMCFSAEDSV